MGVIGLERKNKEAYITPYFEKNFFLSCMQVFVTHKAFPIEPN